MSVDRGLSEPECVSRGTERDRHARKRKKDEAKENDKERQGKTTNDTEIQIIRRQHAQAWSRAKGLRKVEGGVRGGLGQFDRVRMSLGVG